MPDLRPPTERRGPDTDRLTRVFGIRTDDLAPGSSRLSQTVPRALLDHRGQATIASIGPFCDLAIGSPAALARDVPSAGVLTHLHIAAAADLPSDGDVASDGSVRRLDDDGALCTAEVADHDGRGVLYLTGRSMRVDRAVLDAGDYLDAVVAPPEGGPLPEPDPTAPGLDIVRDIAAGRLPRGPLGDSLALEYADVARGGVTLSIPTAPWMANPMGAVHGGVLVTLVESAVGVAGQTLTAPGQEYRTSEVALDYLRSPAVDGTPVLATVVPVRLGRRLAVLDVAIVSPEGRLFVRASATIRLR